MKPLDQFVLANQPAVKRLAARYRRAVPRNERDDLHQEGLLGLCEGFRQGLGTEQCLAMANARMSAVAYDVKARARRESLTVDAPRREEGES